MRTIQAFLFRARQLFPDDKEMAFDDNGKTTDWHYGFRFSPDMLSPSSPK
jgi:hypothetical protein